jgi:hypothetical protein
LGQVGAIVAASGVRVQSSPGFGGYIKRLTAFFAKLRKQAFAASVAVDIGGIEEVNSQIQGAVQGG